VQVIVLTGHRNHPLLHMLADISLPVAAFLCAKDLALSEQAQLFDKTTLRLSWCRLAEKSIQTLTPWSWSCLVSDNPVEMYGHSPEIQASDVLRMHSPKMLLDRIAQMSGSFLTVPTPWAPFVVATSRQALQASPIMHVSHEGHSHHFGVPECASIPLCLGTSKGNQLVVGMHLASTDGNVDESCLLGVDIPGRSGCFSFTFAPISGRCFMHFPREESILVAAALPHAERANWEEEQAQSVNFVKAWLRVESDGSIAFYREVQDGSMEYTGVMPNKALPQWASEYHAAVHFETTLLSSQTSVHIIYAGQELPPALAQLSCFEFAASWDVLNE